MIGKQQLFLLIFLVISTTTITITNKNSNVPLNHDKKDKPAYQASPAQYIRNSLPSASKLQTIPTEKSMSQKERQREKPSEESSTSQSSSKDSDGVVIADAKIKYQDKDKKSKQPPKISKGLRFNPKKSLEKTVASNSKLEQSEAQDANTFSMFSIIVIYITSFFAVLLMIKHYYFPEQAIIEVILDMGIMIQNYLRSKRSGYKAPEFSEEIDDFNSVTVGYNEQHGNKLFWEKNSVEGI